MRIEIWADGASCGNSFGPGGWCALIKIDDEVVCNAYGGDAETTNNAMELKAVIGGIEALIAHLGIHGIDRAEEITITSDSYYVIGAFKDGWIERWKARNWVGRGEDGKRPNHSLFKQLDQLVGDLSIYGPVFFNHVRGHVGIPENEYCDKVAKSVKERIKAEVRQ